MNGFMTPARRRWAYRVGIAALALLGVYGYVDGERIAVWSVLVAALLGMADANVPATVETLDPGDDG